MQPKIILASTSPRREALLKQIGVRFDIIASNSSENYDPMLSPAQIARAIAERKCAAVAALYPDAFVIAADTIVVLNEEILGKPSSLDKAKETLRRLSNQKHQVITGLAVEWRAKKISESLSVTTDVLFTALSDELIEKYVNTDEPLDKAGAYGTQGLGAILVRAIEGSYSSMVGLPLFELGELLRRHLGNDVLWEIT
jgi:septum formation protein